MSSFRSDQSQISEYLARLTLYRRQNDDRLGLMHVRDVQPGYAVIRPQGSDLVSTVST